MEGQPSPPASSGDNFDSFFDKGSSFDSPTSKPHPPTLHSPPSKHKPPTSVPPSLSPRKEPIPRSFESPPFQIEAPFLAHDGSQPQSPAPSSPSSISRSASLSSLVPQKASFMANFGQPWGLFQSEEDQGPAETVRHPLMGQQHPLSDEEEEGVPALSPSKHPAASASSTTEAVSNSPESVSSAKPVMDPSLLSFSRLSVSYSMSDVSSLSKLARQGAWRALVEKVKAAKKRGALATPDEELTYGTYHLLALMKLRSFGAAADELAALGDLDSPDYQYDQYPSLYPGKSGSMVPFALRWMHAELPHRTGQTATTMTHFYALLAVCNSRAGGIPENVFMFYFDHWLDVFSYFLAHLNGSTKVGLSNLSALPGLEYVEQIEALQADLSDIQPTSTSPKTAPNIDEPSQDKDVTTAGTEGNLGVGRDEPVEPVKRSVEDVGTSGEEEEFGEFVASEASVAGKPLLTWMKRKEAIVYALVGHHLYQKQFIVALQWLDQLLARSPKDADLLSKVGYVQLQLGDLLGAQKTFSQVEALLTDASDDDLVNVAGRNRGLLHFAEKQYTKAFNEFNAVLDRNPHDTVSANNKALCLMYSRELIAATAVLEDSLQASPKTGLNETLILNLCSMYELAALNSVEAKRTLSTWLLNHAPDDFDLSCTRL